MTAKISSAWRGWLVTAALLPILLFTLPRFETMQLRLFCAPAAHLAGLFVGAPVQSISNGYGIAAVKPIEVTLDCSAIRFFALVLAVLAGLAAERRWPARRCALVLPCAYLLTLIGNVSRIVSTWYTDSFAALYLPVPLLPGVHALVGALVFMSVLSAGYLLLWRTNDEPDRTRPAA